MPKEAHALLGLPFLPILFFCSLLDICCAAETPRMPGEGATTYRPTHGPLVDQCCSGRDAIVRGVATNSRQATSVLNMAYF